MIRSILLLGLIALGACDNPAAPGPGVPPATAPPPSRRIVAASSVTDLGKPVGAASAYAYDVNGAGHTAGYAVNRGGWARGFVWRSPGVFETLNPLPSYVASFAFGINDTGHVIGVSQSAAGQSEAIMWINGWPTGLGTLVPGGQSFGMAVNSHGAAAGSATAADGTMRAFHHASTTGRMRTVGLLPGGTYTVGQDLNDAGQLVGYGDTPEGDRAFLFDASDGAMLNLGTIPGGISSYALSINARAQVVGFAFTAEGLPHAFLWQGGTMADLGTLGGTQSVAFGINDAGDVVGYSQVASGEFHAFVWTAASGMLDLGTLPGGSVSYAQQINIDGLTAGIALGADGRERAVQWMVTLE